MTRASGAGLFGFGGRRHTTYFSEFQKSTISIAAPFGRSCRTLRGDLRKAFRNLGIRKDVSKLGIRSPDAAHPLSKNKKSPPRCDFLSVSEVTRWHNDHRRSSQLDAEAEPATKFCDGRIPPYAVDQTASSFGIILIAGSCRIESPHSSWHRR